MGIEACIQSAGKNIVPAMATQIDSEQR